MSVSTMTLHALDDMVFRLPKRLRHGPGDWATIEIACPEDGKPLKVFGTVMDMIGRRPKRVRIQQGCRPRQGDVVMPSEYRFVRWTDQERD